MIEPKVIKSRIKIWKLGKGGYELEKAAMLQSILGTKVIYDNPLPEKEYKAKCDVCLVQEQGYACDRITNAPGPYEFEGGCMDCRYLCRQSPVHIGVRNYCQRHMPILNQKIGVTNVKNQ